MQVAVVRTHARLPEQTAFGLHEVLEVTLGEGAHRGHAGRARRGGHDDDLVFGNAAQLAEDLPTPCVSRSVCLLMKGNFRRSARLSISGETPASSQARL